MCVEKKKKGKRKRVAWEATQKSNRDRELRIIGEEKKKEERDLHRV